MLKIYILIASALLFIGCSVEKKPKVHSTMFQTVNVQNAILVQSSKNKYSCKRCGMNLVKFYKTSHKAIYKGKALQYCSIHCLQEHLSHGITLKNPQVVDVDSLKFINVKEAHYVVGSKKRGTMTRVSKYAFFDRNMAKKFQAKYGGKIMDFSAALEVAKKDFKNH